MALTISGENIYISPDEILGDKHFLHVDYNELKGQNESNKVIHHTMPGRIDMIFAAGDKVIGVESKKPEDLINSIMNRRLARQFKKLREMVDIPILLIKGPIPEEIELMAWENKKKFRVVYDWYHTITTKTTYGTEYRSLGNALFECARWQMLGGIVLYGSEYDYEIPPYLLSCRKFLSGGQNVLMALAGDDRKVKPKTNYKGWLLECIPGIGKTTALKLWNAAAIYSNLSPTLCILNASEENLKKWGATSRQAKAIIEARE